MTGPLALVLAARTDDRHVVRGFAPAGQDLKFDGERVFKWSNRHCGDNKAKHDSSFLAPEPAISEPYFEGTSERILIVGKHEWHLRYESADWRKNVGGSVSALPSIDRALADRARRTCSALDLSVAGVDYLITAQGPILLEVNAYPGLTDAPGAEDAFVEEALRWWSESTTAG
jgi:glutathione synthase/RimK-type ligase-like ATP-grasp enzyme